MAKSKKKKHQYQKRNGTMAEWKPATPGQNAWAVILFVVKLVLLLLSHFIVPHQATVLIHVILFCVQMAEFVAFLSLKRKGSLILKCMSAGFMMFFYMIFYLAAAHRYHFFDGYFPFWLPALILTALVTTLLMVATANVVWKNLGWKWRIFAISLIAFLLFVAFFEMIGHLNYVLDTKGPQQYTAVIEDKDYTHYRKGPDSYEFRVTVDGETFDLNVSVLEYGRYEIGDTYTFYRYEGAFGKPFYLAE